MNYIDWNNSLPSFYICPDEKVNADSLAETSKSLASSDTDIAIVKDFLTELANTTYYNLEALKSFVGKIKIPSNEYLNLVKKVSHNYTYQMANQEGKIAANNMYQITTEHGLCYAYNSQVAKSLHLKPSEVGVPFSRTYIQGVIAIQLIHLSSPYTVYAESPWDVPTIGSVEFSGKCVANGFIGLEMGMDILYATEAVYKMPIKRRKCRFANESNLQISSIYSQNMCHSQCRIQLALKLCGCAPFFYDLLVKAGVKICDVDGMMCLAKYKERLISITGKETKKIFSCHCHAACESMSMKSPTDPIKIDKWSYGGGTNFRFRVIEFPTVRLKRDVIFTFADLLVSFGGAAGLFIGISVLSLVEIIYYLTLRLFFYLRDLHLSQKNSRNGQFFSHPSTLIRNIYGK